MRRVPDFQSPFQPPAKVGANGGTKGASNPLPTPVLIYPHTPKGFGTPLGGGSTPPPGVQQIADTLADLARRVRRLRPDHRDPEHFHEEKSEIEHALRKLARGVG